MLSDLINLSNELYELDMVEESLSIDAMIEKLYGNGIAKESDRYKYNTSDEYSESLLAIKSEISKNLTNNKFKKDLASIIYEELDDEGVIEVKRLLNNFIK
tara:strand:- start:451 stop:753 length:303 start_codon:yes stop_codon:yes gene_type:complete